jgi:quinol monooxygenase YgiN
MEPKLRGEVTMSENVLVVAEVTINAGQLDNLKALVGEMIEAIKRDEPGTHNYEWFIGDDGKSVHVYERYADSEAFMVHLGNLGQKFAKRLSACTTTTRITIYGNPSDKVREVFATYPTVYMSPLVGFVANSQIVDSEVLAG